MTLKATNPLIVISFPLLLLGAVSCGGGGSSGATGVPDVLADGSNAAAGSEADIGTDCAASASCDAGTPQINEQNYASLVRTGIAAFEAVYGPEHPLRWRTLVREYATHEGQEPLEFSEQEIPFPCQISGLVYKSGQSSFFATEQSLRFEQCATDAGVMNGIVTLQQGLAVDSETARDEFNERYDIRWTDAQGIDHEFRALVKRVDTLPGADTSNALAGQHNELGASLYRFGPEGNQSLVALDSAVYTRQMIVGEAQEVSSTLEGTWQVAGPLDSVVDVAAGLGSLPGLRFSTDESLLRDASGLVSGRLKMTATDGSELIATAADSPATISVSLSVDGAVVQSFMLPSAELFPR